MTRVAAPEIEAVISKAITANLAPDGERPLEGPENLSREMIERFVIRIEIRKSQLAIHLRTGDGSEPDTAPPRLVVVPWKKPSKPARRILLPADRPEHRKWPMKAERRSALIRSIGRGRLWFQEIVDDQETIESLAVRQHCSTRHFNMTISPAFISLTLVKAAVEGRFPRGIGVAALRDAPAEWSEQMRRLGLAQ